MKLVPDLRDRQARFLESVMVPVSGKYVVDLSISLRCYVGGVSDVLVVMYSCAVAEGNCKLHFQSKTEQRLCPELHLQRCSAVLPAKGMLCLVSYGLKS